MELRAVRALWVIFLAVAVAGCSSAGGPVHEEAPVWQSGYAWTYAIELERNFVEREGDERDNGTYAEKWREVREVFNTTMAADGEPYYVVAAHQSGDRDDRSVMLVRQRDLGRLPYSPSSSQSCFDDVCTQSFRIREINTSTPDFLDFPLERGKRWSGTFGSGPRVFAFQAEVDGAYEVATGLGMMKAARISFHYQPTDLAQMRTEILSEARAEGYQVDELRIAMSERHLVYYSSDYQAIVRQDVRWQESFYARGTEPSGERFEFEETHDSRVTAVVEGARLLPRAERTLDDVAAFMAGRLALRDPTGQSVGGVSYKIGVDPPNAVVNAGVGEAANFTARIDGEMPDTHTLRWRLVDEDGAVAASGGGTSFAPAPTRPGRYTVELDAMAGNETVAAAGATLVGDWHTTQRVDCGPVTLFDLCVEQAVPVHPGARSLLVRVAPDDPYVDGLVDAVELIDSAGTRIQATEGPQGWTVALDPIEGYLVDADAWSLEFRRGVAALSAADIEVQVVYSGGAAGAPADPASDILALGPLHDDLRPSRWASR